jgi:hypothetical protein
MTFPSEERTADEAEVADVELAQEDRTADPAGVADVELAHEDRTAGPAGVAYAPPPAQFRSTQSVPGGAVADGGTGAERGAPVDAGTPVPGGTGTDGGNPVDPVADGRWSKIQAMFVDDPHASVVEAANLVDEAIEAFITIVREQQASLASSWQAEDVGTEQLRATFREYRTFWNSVTGLSQPA